MVKIILQGTHYRVPDEIKAYLDKKLSSLDSLFPRLLDARVELAFDQAVKEGRPFRAEINLRVPGKLLRAESTGGSVLEAIDIVIDEIKRELIEFKERLQP